MATTKKTTKKTTTAKKAPAKRPAAKKTAPKRKSQAVSKKSDMRSFHVAADQPPFNTFRITRQTLYWVILVAFIVFAQLWIISLQVEVAILLDAQQAQLQDV